MVTEIFLSIEKIVLLWGIVQLRFQRNKLRIVCGVLLVAISKLFYLYVPNFDLAMMLGALLGAALGVCLLFEGELIKNIIKYWFAFFYIDFVYLPIELLMSGVISLFDVNNESEVFIIFKSALAIAVIFCYHY